MVEGERPLRIGLVLDRFDPPRGGLELWTRDLAVWLRDRGHAVTIVAFGAPHREPGLDVALAAPAWWPLERAARIGERLATLDLDIVHDTGTGARADVFQPQTGSRALNAARDIAALPFPSRWRARFSPRRRRMRSEIVRLERAQFADPSRIIAVSKQVRDSLAQRYGLEAAAITVIPNGVDASAFEPAGLSRRRAAARAAWNLRDETVFLLVAGNFHLKGVATAIRALARPELAAARAHLLVVGGDEPAPYRALAERLGVALRVTFAGRIAEIQGACAAADVALQPTLHDACSLATLEGLAAGLPTITTAANGAGELITEGVEGLILADPRDVTALAAAMARLEPAELRGRMGQAARRLAMGNDVRIRFEAIEGFYRRRLAANAEDQAAIGLTSPRRPASSR